MKYKFLDHTADTKIQAFGKTLEESFSNAAIAMFEIMTDTSKIKRKLTKKIKIKASDKEALLYKWLEELLFLLDTEFFLLSTIENMEIKKEQEYLLKAEITGDIAEKYDIHGSVKAVTYNEMLIREEKEKVMIQFVLDI